MEMKQITKFKLDGRIYKTIVFNSIQKTNQFLEIAPLWGLLHVDEINSKYYVAMNNDKGKLSLKRFAQMANRAHKNASSRVEESNQ